MYRILVLGGYGNFGRLICENLAKRSDIELIIGGRNKKKADSACKLLKENHAQCRISSISIDIHSDQLVQILEEMRPYIVVHTCGPFQNQSYHVPRACITAGCHYIDLADDRRFVCNFATLNDLAIQNGLIAISGASSVPGVSSLIIDHYAEEFTKLEVIDFCITPGSNVALGEATLKGILSYIGQPFKSWEHEKWRDRYGWMDSCKVHLGKTLGTRWLANVNVPDLELFPARYPRIKIVRFRAGHELGIVHLSMNFMAQIARCRLFRHWNRYSSTFFRVGQSIKAFGTDCGGMVIQLAGTNHQGKQQKIIWRMIAKGGVGPRIPTVATIILVNRILDAELTEPGARPCLGMFTQEDFFNIAGEWGIYREEERSVA